MPENEFIALWENAVRQRVLQRALAPHYCDMAQSPKYCAICVTGRFARDSNFRVSKEWSKYWAKIA